MCLFGNKLTRPYDLELLVEWWSPMKLEELKESIRYEVNESPWGTWEVLIDHKSYKVKRIVINPEQRLSYQKHSKREEFWMIVEGEAEVILEDEPHYLKAGENIHIPLEAKHRIKNTSNNNQLVFIEIQRGTYFGEDDIVRFEDDYGRS